MSLRKARILYRKGATGRAGTRDVNLARRGPTRRWSRPLKSAAAQRQAVSVVTMDRLSWALAGFLVFARASHVEAGSATDSWCIGDCNGDDRVTVNEIIRVININLERADCTACPQWCEREPCQIECFTFEPIANLMRGCANKPVEPTPKGGAAHRRR